MLWHIVEENKYYSPDFSLREDMSIKKVVAYKVTIQSLINPCRIFFSII